MKSKLQNAKTKFINGEWLNGQNLSVLIQIYSDAIIHQRQTQDLSSYERLVKNQVKYEGLNIITHIVKNLYDFKIIITFSFTIIYVTEWEDE